jgi:uncharacterized protein (TIGR04255 family)
MKTMEPLPKFDAPPVVETAMGVQFARLSGFSTALVGWFWKAYLPPISPTAKWEKFADVPRLQDRFEQFGEQERWGQLGVRMSQVLEPQRVQIIQLGEERMVQVQDSRFILNWRKQAAAYPSFTTLTKEFGLTYPAFERFSLEADLGIIEPNQWEMTYVNHIPKDGLWASEHQWGNVIPDLRLPSALVSEPTAGPISLDWRYDFSEERGRLYASIQNAKTSTSSDNFMQLTLTARGQIDREKGWSMEQGFDLGHEAIVRTFTAMTSPAAHKIWKRRI